MIAQLAGSRAGRAVAAATAAALFAGCASTHTPEQIATYTAGKPGALKPAYAAVLTGGERDYVLNNLNVGLAAWDLGFDLLADEAFGNALAGIGSIYAKTEQAAKARSLWREEGAKTYIGEPYERMMAYYYRGLLFLRRGDHDNARAAFENAIQQDAFAEEEQDRCDVALLYFLKGWALRARGDEQGAQEQFALAKNINPRFALPPAEHNTLVIVELGRAPIKWQTGLYDEVLKISRGSDFSESAARVRNGAEPLAATLALEEDIFLQASTRGARPIDAILRDKAVFKKEATETSEEAMVFGMQIVYAGLVMAGSGKGAAKANDDRSDSVQSGAEGAIVAGLIVAAFGGVVVLFGATYWGIASLVRAEADDRAWSNLPDRIQAYTFRSDPGFRILEADFVNSGGGVAQPPRAFDLNYDQSGFGFGWTRSRPALDEWRQRTDRRFDREELRR